MLIITWLSGVHVTIKWWSWDDNVMNISWLNILYLYYMNIIWRMPDDYLMIIWWSSEVTWMITCLLSDYHVLNICWSAVDYPMIIWWVSDDKLMLSLKLSTDDHILKSKDNLKIFCWLSVDHWSMLTWVRVRYYLMIIWWSN